jgi:micrococcal nuclease
MRARAVFTIIAAVAMMVCPLPAAALADDTVTTTALVLKVVDGDTIDIRDDNWGRLRVRLLGIFPVKSAC